MRQHWVARFATTVTSFLFVVHTRRISDEYRFKPKSFVFISIVYMYSIIYFLNFYDKEFIIVFSLECQSIQKWLLCFTNFWHLSVTASWLNIQFKLFSTLTHCSELFENRKGWCIFSYCNYNFSILSRSVTRKKSFTLCSYHWIVSSN